MWFRGTDAFCPPPNQRQFRRARRTQNCVFDYYIVCECRKYQHRTAVQRQRRMNLDRGVQQHVSQSCLGSLILFTIEQQWKLISEPVLLLLLLLIEMMATGWIAPHVFINIPREPELLSASRVGRKTQRWALNIYAIFPFLALGHYLGMQMAPRETLTVGCLSVNCLQKLELRFFGISLRNNLPV